MPDFLTSTRDPARDARGRRRSARRHDHHAGRSPSSRRRANRLGHVLAGLGAGRGTKVVWCGQNSPGVVVMVNAARKVGATAVPLNYRLSRRGGGVRHRPLRRHRRVRRRRVRADVRARSAPSIPKVAAHPRVRRSGARRGCRGRTPIVDDGARRRRRPPDGGEAGAHDDLHVGHDGQAEGRAARRAPATRRRCMAHARR